VLLWAMIVQSLRDRIAGSAAGMLWLAVYPLLFLGMYTLVFVVILQVRVPELNSSTYVLSIFCALVPFLAFAESFASGTVSLSSSGSIVKNKLFPVELVPVKEVIAGHTYMAFGLIMMLVVAIVFDGIHLTQVLLPVFYVLQIAMTIGLVWITSTVNVFFRDVGKIAPILVLFLMLVSPIAYTSEMVPPNMAPFLMINPLVVFINIYRKILLDGTIPLWEVAIAIALSVALYTLGYHLLSRLKPMVSDYV
jgi:lipopolysaccharide transport system permease protein